MADPKKRGPLAIWLNPAAVLVLLAAAVTARLTSMSEILLPGLLAYGLLVFLKYQAAAAKGGDDEAPVEPDTSAMNKPYAARVHRSVAIQKAILAELERATGDQRALLAGTAGRVRHLTLAVARLTAQLQDLDRHLSVTSPHDLARETRSLEQLVASATDSIAREGYERGLAQQKQKAKVFEELGARRERLDAQIVNVEQALETVKTQIIRIKSTDTAELSAEGVRIAESLDQLTVDVDAVAETVDETAAAYRRMNG